MGSHVSDILLDIIMSARLVRPEVTGQLGGPGRSCAGRLPARLPTRTTPPKLTASRKDEACFIATPHKSRLGTLRTRQIAELLQLSAASRASSHSCLQICSHMEQFQNALHMLLGCMLR
jgi:hypothetical protein